MVDHPESQNESQELSDDELKFVAGGSEPGINVKGETKAFDDTTHEALKTLTSGTDCNPKFK
jgi:hypothetical protein